MSCQETFSLRSMLLVAVVLVVSLSLLMFIVRGTHNLFFHSLRGFPGPFWSRVTDLAKLSALSCSDITTYSLRLHKDFGTIVRIAPNLLSFSDARMVPLVYHREVDKDEFWTAGALGAHAPLIQIRGHGEHAKKRKCVAPIFSIRILQDLEPRIDLEIQLFLMQIRKHFAKSKRKANLSQWVQWFLYDTITDLLFRKRLGFVEKGADVDGLLAAFRSTGWIIGLICLFPYLFRPLLQLPVIGQYLLPRKCDGNGIGKVMRYRDTFSRGASFDTEATLISLLRDYQSTHPEDITDEDLSAETLLLMVAGPDTTSALICATIENIISEPKIYARVMLEIRDFTSRGVLDDPIASFAQIQSMPYFTSCVWESARLSPPIPVVLPRKVSSGGIVLDGQFIPEGTSIGASPSVINRDPCIFGTDVEVFRPERWLGPKDAVKQMHRFLFTWGFGSRKCVGRNLALMETYKLCVQLLRDFDMEFEISHNQGSRREDKGFAIYDDLHLYFRER